MSVKMNENNLLEKSYELRFNHMTDYRSQVWKTLCKHFFQQFIPQNATILDLGSGYGEFINNIAAQKKIAMDLNSSTRQHLAPEVDLIAQNCADPWDIPNNSLDCVFSSNFLEHLYERSDVEHVIASAFKHLKPGGKLIFLGPNFKYAFQEYWDFWDHRIAITDNSLAELLKVNQFKIEKKIARFLPFSMGERRQYPMFILRSYLKMPPAWRLFGKQFFIVASKAL